MKYRFELRDLKQKTTTYYREEDWNFAWALIFAMGIFIGSVLTMVFYNVFNL